MHFLLQYVHEISLVLVLSPSVILVFGVCDIMTYIVNLYIYNIAMCPLYKVHLNTSVKAWCDIHIAVPLKNTHNEAHKIQA